MFLQINAAYRGGYYFCTQGVSAFVRAAGYGGDLRVVTIVRIYLCSFSFDDVFLKYRFECARARVVSGRVYRWVCLTGVFHIYLSFLMVGVVRYDYPAVRGRIVVVFRVLRGVAGGVCFLGYSQGGSDTFGRRRFYVLTRGGFTVLVHVGVLLSFYDWVGVLT